VERDAFIPKIDDRRDVVGRRRNRTMAVHRNSRVLVCKGTFGKRLVGIQVTDLEGKPVSFGRASGRFFGRLIPTLGIGYCTILFTRRKQALHDLISRCVVIRGDEGRTTRE
jgi:hypothetical protein